MLSQLVIIANYLHPLVSSKNHEKMDKVSLACLLNEAAHACAKVKMIPKSFFILLLRIFLFFRHCDDF